MPSTNYAYVNGRFLPESQATISIFDRGFLYGAGVFETMRVYSGKIFRLYEHLDRLAAGLKHLGIDSPLSPEELRAILCLLVERNEVRDGVARIQVTSGGSRLWMSPLHDQGASVVIVAQEREHPTGELTAIISSIRLDRVLSRHKTANRLVYMLAKQEAERAGAHEAVLLSGMGRVMEFTASNLFVVKHGALYTPPLTDAPLPGITRDLVLTLARELRIATHETTLSLDFLCAADELFATSSLIEILPVTQLNGRRIRAQKTARRLHARYREVVVAELGL